GSLRDGHHGPGRRTADTRSGEGARGAAASARCGVSEVMNRTRRMTAARGSSRGLFLIAVLAGCMTGFGFLGLGSAMGDTATARFADADGLVTGNDVRIAGEIAGSVTSVDFAVDQTTGKQFAQVQFQVDGSHWPLHKGTF